MPQSCLSFEDIGKYGENTSHFSTCLQFHFPYNLAKQNINRSVKDVKEHKLKFMINCVYINVPVIMTNCRVFHL